MHSGATLLAVIPARAGSKGLPHKNILECAGKPLITWTIAAARAVGTLDQVLVSTDSEEIAEVSRRAGAEVPFLRPDVLATDDASLLDAVRHSWEHHTSPSGAPYDYVVILQPTSPLRDARHIAMAIDFYFENRHSERDTLASVVAVGEKYGWLMQPRKGRPHVRFCFDVSVGNPRRQLLQSYFLPNGAIFIAKGTALTAGLYGDDTLPFVMRAEDSLDIDLPEDFREAETALRRRGGTTGDLERGEGAT